MLLELKRRDRKEIVGYICGTLEDCDGKLCGHIVSIAIDPNFRGRGLGKILMRKAIEYFIRRGATLVYLECRISNTSAIRFYESLGFEKSGIIRRYYADGEDAVVFKLDLTRE